MADCPRAVLRFHIPQGTTTRRTDRETRRNGSVQAARTTGEASARLQLLASEAFECLFRQNIPIERGNSSRPASDLIGLASFVVLKECRYGLRERRHALAIHEFTCS